MDLSLKKARKLESKIAAFIAANSDNQTHFQARVNSSIEDIEKQAVEERTKFFDNMKNLNDLNSIRYTIRRLISEANASGGDNSIDSYLNEKVELETKLCRMNQLFGVNTFNKALIEDELSNQKKMLEASYTNHYHRGSTSFYVNFLVEADLEKFKADKHLASKRIEELEDKLAELNFSRRISLDANSVKLLQDNGLV